MTTNTSKIGDTIQYTTISNKIRTVRITDFEENGTVFIGEWLDAPQDDDLGGEVWGYVSDIITAPTPEPQTAAFQSAVDNVWFENTRNGSSIRATWNFDLWNSRMDQLDYAMDLEEKIARALNVRELDYELSS